MLIPSPIFFSCLESLQLFAKQKVIFIFSHFFTICAFLHSLTSCSTKTHTNTYHFYIQTTVHPHQCTVVDFFCCCLPSDIMKTWIPQKTHFLPNIAKLFQFFFHFTCSVLLITMDRVHINFWIVFDIAMLAISIINVCPKGLFLSFFVINQFLGIFTS